MFPTPTDENPYHCDICGCAMLILKCYLNNGQIPLKNDAAVRESIIEVKQMQIICADTNKYDDEYRILLTTVGTRRDLEEYRIVLTNGMKLTFYMDDADENGNEDNLIFDGIVEYDELNKRWVAVIDWDAFKHESDFSPSELENLGMP